MRCGAASMMRRTTFCERPARGGSTTSDVGPAGALDELAHARARTSPAKKLRVGDLVERARSRSRRRPPPRRSRRPTPRRRAARATGRSCRSRSRGRRRARSRCSAGVLGGDAVEPLGHLGVGLEERLGRDRGSAGRRAPRRAVGAPATSSVSPPAVRLADARRSASTSSAVARRRRATQRVGVELARRGDEPHLQLAGAAALADDEVAQEARLRRGGRRRSSPCVAAPRRAPARAARCRARRRACSPRRATIVVPASRARGSRRRARRPSPVAERVLELVAVAPLLDGGDDRLELEAVELADAPQRVVDLLGLDLELALVGQHLPRRARVVGDAARCGRATARAPRPRAPRRRRACACRRRARTRSPGIAPRDEHDVAVERARRRCRRSASESIVSSSSSPRAGRDGGSWAAAQDAGSLSRAFARSPCSTDLRFALRRS